MPFLTPNQQCQSTEGKKESCTEYSLKSGYVVLEICDRTNRHDIQAYRSTSHPARGKVSTTTTTEGCVHADDNSQPSRNVQIPLRRPDETLSQTRVSDKSANFVWSGPVWRVPV